MFLFYLVTAAIAFFAIRNIKSAIKSGSSGEWTPAIPADDGQKAGSGSPTAKSADSPKSADAPQKADAPRKAGTDAPLKKAGTIQKPAAAITYGLVGKPLGHSKSEILFRKKFLHEGIPAEYLNFELDNSADIRQLVEENPRIMGLNVTLPYKTEIIQYLDEIDETARQIGAVNVIKVIRNDGRIWLKGYNTDHIGFERSLRPMLQDRTVKALILGTGGASKAVAYALSQMGIEYRFVSRTSSFDNLGYYELSPSIMEEYPLIVNCTPVGMHPDTDQCPDIPYAYITADHILYDLVYNPETTLFMQKGMDHEASVKNGAEMLQIQAEEAYRIWTEQN